METPKDGMTAALTVNSRATYFEGPFCFLPLASVL